MTKIAILACLRANDVCAGAACLEALNGRRAHFQIYENDEVRLCAFLRCSRCGVDPKDDPGMLEKLERLIHCGIETAHIGVCCQGRDHARCPHMEKAAEWLKNRGVQIVWGTH